MRVPTAASRTSGRRATASPTRAAPCRDVTTTQSTRSAVSKAAVDRRTPVGDVDDLDQRHMHDIGAGLERAIDRARPVRRGSSPPAGPSAAASPPRSSGGDGTRGPRRAAVLRRRRSSSRSPESDTASLNTRSSASPARKTWRVSPATYAPTGIVHPAPSSARKARSIVTARRVGGVIDHAQGVERDGVTGATFDGHATLADGGHELDRIEQLGDTIGEPQHLERRQRHDDRTTVGDPLEPGRDVAAQLVELEIGTHASELRPPPNRPRRHRGTVGEPASVDPIRTSATDRRSTKAPISSPRRIAGGKVLGGVHGDRRRDRRARPVAPPS